MEGKVRSWFRAVAIVLVAFTAASVPVVGQEVKKSVPNIFTPNGDGINDRITLESKETMVFVVYNREGGVVFRAEGRQRIKVLFTFRQIKIQGGEEGSRCGVKGVDSLLRSEIRRAQGWKFLIIG